MVIAPRVATRLTTLATLASIAVGMLGALAMSDRVRLVDIVSLFFGGVGAGAGTAALIVQRRRHHLRTGGLAKSAPYVEPPHTPPTVPWREPPRS